MGKFIEVQCPCCEAKLKIDPVTQAVITFEEKKKAPVIEDFNKAVQNLKSEAAKRDEAFEKSLQANKNQADIFNKKFDELLKKAKSEPDAKPPRKPFDLD